MTVRFRIVTADGKVHVGAVQGCGGTVSGRHALRRMWVEIGRATEGDPLGIFEPQPGCCCLYPGYSAFGNGPRQHVPLAGATVSQLTERENARIGRMANAVALLRGAIPAGGQ